MYGYEEEQASEAEMSAQAEYEAGLDAQAQAEAENDNMFRRELEDTINSALSTDGAHHKQWYLEELALLLGVKTEEHEKGIAP